MARAWREHAAAATATRAKGVFVAGARRALRHAPRSFWVAVDDEFGEVGDDFGEVIGVFYGERAAEPLLGLVEAFVVGCVVARSAAARPRTCGWVAVGSV
jgi:hypothetical protein